MNKMAYSLEEIGTCLKNLEREVLRLGEMARDIPAVQKNLGPITTFLDVIRFHLMTEQKMD
jgi:hypothetical protein